MNEDSQNLDAVHKVALDHARAMAINASDLRMKNFNFFLIIMGVAMTAYINLGRNARLGLGVLGALVSLAFLLLDLRGRELLDAAYGELLVRESALGISIVKARKRKFLKKTISHTFVYRAIYFLGVALSFVLAIFALRQTR